MFISLSETIAWLIHYKYAVILPIAVVEGPIVTIIGGFLAAHGFLNVYIVYLIVVIGDLMGDTLYYLLGRWSRRPFLINWGRFFGITQERLTKLERHYEKHSGKTLIFGKISHGIGSGILIAAGVAKMPIRDFLWFNFLGTLPKSLLLLIIGYYFGQAYRQIGRYIDYTAIFFVGGLIIILILYLLVAKLKKIFSKYSQ